MSEFVWLNGSFGSGKTTIAQHLVAANPLWRVFDPEYVGFMLGPQFPESQVTDFQDFPSWRRLVPIVAAEIARETGQNLLIVQTVLNQKYWTEIADGIREQGHSVHHVLIDADSQALRQRIVADQLLYRAAGWRLQHISTFLEARRDWLCTAADLVIDTTSASPQKAADQLSAALAHWSVGTDPGEPQ